MTEVRCTCSRKLGMIEGKAEIVCPKCKSLNIVDTNVNKHKVIKKS